MRAVRNKRDVDTVHAQHYVCGKAIAGNSFQQRETMTAPGRARKSSQHAPRQQ